MGSMNKKNLKQYALNYKIAFFCFFLCVILSSASVLAIGKGLSFFIDKGIASKNAEILSNSLFFLFTIVSVLALATFGRFFLITYYSEKIILDIREDLFANLLRQDAEFFEKNKVGDLMSRITSDLSLLQSTLSSSISIFLRNSLIFSGCLTILLITNSKLTLFVFAIVPIVILPILFLGKRLRKYSKITQEKVAEMSSMMQENISFVKLVQSFVRENYSNLIFKEHLDAVLKSSFKRIFLRSILTITVIIIVFSGISAILYQGAILVFSGALSAGEFSSFLFYTIMLAGSFAAMAEVFGGVQKAKGATSRLVELLNENPKIIGGEEEIKTFESLEFKDVSFNYPSRSENSLEKISFKINKGEIIALVGKSGSGKSTIFDLLQRFYEINAGEILINGKNIRNYKLEQLRNLFAVTAQDNLVFSDSVKNNLYFANPNSSLENIRTVLKKVGAQGFVNKLKNKEESFLGEKGVRLSGGEKQRIAMARTILKDSAVLLLDEATSHLDSHNEEILQRFILEQKHKKTIIMAAHRLSTIANADVILVIEDGHIIEKGNHKDLLKKQGRYASLANLQKG